MNMPGVILPQTIFPCWAYVLARVGKLDLLTYEWVMEQMPNKLVPYEKAMCSGTIIVWKQKDKGKMFPIQILNDGRIIHRPVRYEYHAAIIEHNIYCTDMVDPDIGKLPFVIRTRKLNDISRRPDYFLPL